MTCRRARAVAVLAFLAAVSLLAVWRPVVAVQAQSPDALLRRADVGAFVPPSFRARLTFSQDGDDDRREMELWRSGADRTLVRLLGPKERGKYLLRLGPVLWFLAPGARDPVKLSPSHRIYGAATVDLLLGLRLSDDYRITGTSSIPSEAGPLVVFELEGASERLQFASVRYTVDPRTARPVTALYRVRSGREAVRLDFLDWSGDGGRYARRIEVRDRLRKDALTRIEVVDYEERAVPEGLFVLGDDTARRALESGGLSPTGS